MAPTNQSSEVRLIQKSLMLDSIKDPPISNLTIAFLGDIQCGFRRNRRTEDNNVYVGKNDGNGNS